MIYLPNVAPLLAPFLRERGGGHSLQVRSSGSNIDRNLLDSDRIAIRQFDFDSDLVGPREIRPGLIEGDITGGFGAETRTRVCHLYLGALDDHPAALRRFSQSQDREGARCAIGFQVDIDANARCLARLGRNRAFDRARALRG